jgi:hypothetical protein
LGCAVAGADAVVVDAGAGAGCCAVGVDIAGPGDEPDGQLTGSGFWEGGGVVWRRAGARETVQGLSRDVYKVDVRNKAWSCGGAGTRASIGDAKERDTAHTHLQSIDSQPWIDF